jgi:hypothetical protein
MRGIEIPCKENFLIKKYAIINAIDKWPTGNMITRVYRKSGIINMHLFFVFYSKSQKRNDNYFYYAATFPLEFRIQPVS